MVQCVKLRRKKRKPCLGDLDTEITLQSRSIKAPTVSVDFSEEFIGLESVWAKLDTRRGKTIFDESEIERDITHEFTIRYFDGLTSEVWVLFEDRRYDVVDIEDFEERHEFMILRCSERGASENLVNHA